MEEREPSPVEIATLAATFIPPLNLPENWKTIDPEALRELLAWEFEPGMVFTGDPETDYRIKVEALQAKSSVGPSQYEVIATAAIRRARLLIDLASGRIPIEPPPGSNSSDRKPSDAEVKKSFTEFNKRFGQDKMASFEEAAKLALSRMSDRNRESLLAHWLKLPESDLSRRGLDLNPKTLSNGVGLTDYPDFKQNLLLLKHLDYPAVEKRLRRADGAKGGRKAQRLPDKKKILKRSRKG